MQELAEWMAFLHLKGALKRKSLRNWTTRGACTTHSVLSKYKSLWARGQLLDAYYPSWCQRQQDREPSFLHFTSWIDRSLMSHVLSLEHKRECMKISLGYVFAMILDWPIRFELWKPGQKFKNVERQFDFRFRAPFISAQRTTPKSPSCCSLFFSDSSFFRCSSFLFNLSSDFFASFLYSFIVSSPSG